MKKPERTNGTRGFLNKFLTQQDLEFNENKRGGKERNEYN